VQQEVGASDASDQTDDGKGNHDAARNVEMLAIRAGAGCDSDPECDRVGGVGCNGSDSGEHQRGEGDEASAAGDGVERATERAGEEQEDDGMQGQI